MASCRFTPLRTHSWHSLLEGVASPAALLGRAAEPGYEAMALTDPNSLAGAVEFSAAARRHGVRAIVGACLRRDRLRVTALAADAGGYRSLCRILSRLPAAQPPAVPRLLADHAEGLHLLCD